MKQIRCGVYVLAAAVLGSAGPATAQRAKRQMAPILISNPAEWITSDSYPPDALRAGRAGRVMVEVGVDSGGKAVSCKVSQSSGTTSLDDRTCELALAHARFDPATDCRGRPVASTYKLPVRWVIPEDNDSVGGEVIDLAKPVSLETEIEWIIGTGGIVESCRAVGAKADDPVGPCKRFSAGVPWGARYTSGGEPVRAVVHERHGRTIEAAALPK